LQVLHLTELSPTALAANARVAPSTLTRFLHDAKHFTKLSAGTIAAIERATGIRYGTDPRLRMPRPEEATPYAYNGDDLASIVIRHLIDRGIILTAYILRSRALEAFGYLPGDLMLVDAGNQPDPGDIVCVKLYDWTQARTEIAFRRWDPPYLVAATSDPELSTPIVPDKDRTTIQGVLIGSLRLSRSIPIRAVS
jgi:hypothetical protein